VIRNQSGPFMKERFSLAGLMALEGLFAANRRIITLVTLKRVSNMGSVLSLVEKAKYLTKAYSTTKA